MEQFQLHEAFFNKVLHINVIERKYVYPVQVAPAPPCSHTLLLVEVEEDPASFFLVFKKHTFFFSRLKALRVHQNV